MLDVLQFIYLIPDPREDYKVVYPLPTLFFSTLCAVLSGCQSWQEIQDYCEARQDWLSRYVDLSMGVPTLWTFRRLFTLIDPAFIEQLLLDITGFLMGSHKSDQIALDGKFQRGSKRHNMRCLKSVSAWCHENGLVLAQRAVEEGSHESQALPLLLGVLNIKGRTISIDAAGCQASMAQTIFEKKGHYVLALKKNQPKLYEVITQHMKEKTQGLSCLIHDEFDEGHGRTVRRRYFAVPLSHLKLEDKWPGLKTALAVETISRTHKKSPTNQWRYYLSSHPAHHPKLAHYIRNHWGIENKLHWVLDVQMGEDQDLKTHRQSAKAFATLRRIAINIVRTKDHTKKRSVRNKMLRASWTQENLLKLLV